jgi:hypothetical protein
MSVATVGPTTAPATPPTTAPPGPAIEPPVTAPTPAPLSLSPVVEHAARPSAAKATKAIFKVDIDISRFLVLGSRFSAESPIAWMRPA